VAGIRCEEYPERCQFAMQVGLFDTASGIDLLPTMNKRETCPTCGSGVEDWAPPFDAVVPGRPVEW
jgi:hypothetical protein